MSEEGADWAAAMMQEYLSGNHQRDASHVPSYIGEIGDQQAREVLIAARQAWRRRAEQGDLGDDQPARFVDTEFGKTIYRSSAARTANIAVSQGDSARMRHFAGAPDQQADISGIEAIEDLHEIVDEDVPQFYIWGQQGAGKTDFSVFLAQISCRQNPALLVGSNIRSLREAHEYVPNYDALMDWMTTCSTPDCDVQLSESNPRCPDHGRPAPKLFVFDEASSHASGRGSDGFSAASKLGPLIYKIRKYGGGYVVIGHDGKDIHPIVRELSTCVHKESKKDATFYESVDNRRGVGEKLSLTGIPPTDWAFDTLEATSWAWEADEDELEAEAMALAEEKAEEDVEEQIEEIVVNMAENGVSQSQIAEIVPWSQSTVSRRLGGKS
jgi:hypothetical protein